MAFAGRRSLRRRFWSRFTACCSKEKNLATRWLPFGRTELFTAGELHLYNNLDKGLNVVDPEDDDFVQGAEFYQVTLGGSADRNAALGKVLGPSFAQEDMPEVIAKIIDVYLENRKEGENFLATYNRLGIEPYKERVYANAD